MTQYLKLKPNEGKTTHIKLDLYYNLGGYNVFTYRQEPRGYYLSACPVERIDRGGGFIMEGFTAYTGTKVLVKEVKRKSVKAEREAEQAAVEWKQKLLNYVLNNNKLELEEDAV